MVVEPTPDEEQYADTDNGSPLSLADDTIKLPSATTATFYVSNADYGTNGGFAMYPWVKDRFIVEPYRTTTVAVDDYAITRFENISDYTWTVSMLGDFATPPDECGIPAVDWRHLSSHVALNGGVTVCL